MKKFTLFFVLLFVSLGMFAIPAKRVSKTVKQSDGSELVIYLTGDESFHYYSTADGVPVKLATNGDYHYARLSREGVFVSTGNIAHEAKQRSAREVSLLQDMAQDNSQSNVARVAARRSERYKAPRRSSSSITPRGEINVPVLLVEFADVKFSFDKETAQQTFNGENYKGPQNPFINETEGSLRDYFKAQSDGLFSPNFVVTDIITLSRNMSYYGANDTNGNDKNPQQMIVDACRAIDDNFDFSIFDNDGDGNIEFLYCLYAGYAEAAGAPEETIWPHQWYLSSYNGKIQLDGVYVDNYACSSELSLNEDVEASYGKNFTGIGSCCHEFSHCLGLPDFYDTSSNNPPNFGMDYWSLMDYGCYNVEGYVPIGYSAYERDFVGWRELPELSVKGDYEMAALTSGGTGYKIVNDLNPDEYYVIENRQKESWDKYIQNSGMMITHVDYSENAWFNNTVNNDADHLRFTLIPADGELLSYYTADNYDEYIEGLKGDVWPGTTNNTELTDYSTPAATVFTGSYMSKPITNITNRNGVVTFSFMKGELEIPQTMSATEVGENSFVANWNAVEDATAYKVTLEKVDENSSGAKETLCAEDFINVASSGVLMFNPNSFTAVTGWTAKNLFTATGAVTVGMANKAGQITTPTMNAKNKVEVSFRIKQYSANESNAVLSVYMLTPNGSKTKLADYPVTDAFVSHSVAIDAPESDFNIEFSTDNSASGMCRVILDDILVTTEMDYIVEHVATIETEDTRYKFENLLAGMTYRYSVAATDGDKVTEYSEYQVVTMCVTGIEDVLLQGDGNVAYYDLTGRVVANPGKGLYIEKNGGRTQKIYLK
ncbi:MAG: M6 family metalloprotease domain-containing protein [Bacteroidaceae bacterium]|nr:M6 family metalloprotease domain-containing protein [Bacteroidaceae bacterium]